MAEEIKKEELKETKLKELQLSDEDLDNVSGGAFPIGPVPEG